MAEPKPRQGPKCRRCGANLRPALEYCARCGERRYPQPAWRAPLIAAAIVIALSAIAFALVYSGLSSSADDEAKSQASASIVANTESASAPVA